MAGSVLVHASNMTLGDSLLPLSSPSPPPLFPLSSPSVPLSVIALPRAPPLLHVFWMCCTEYTSCTLCHLLLCSALLTSAALLPPVPAHTTFHLPSATCYLLYMYSVCAAPNTFSSTICHMLLCSATIMP